MSAVNSQIDNEYLIEIYNNYKNNSNYCELVESFKNIDFSNKSNIEISDNSQIYYKYICKSNIMKKFTYKEGLNIDTNEFNSTDNCAKGGLYFTDLKNIHYFDNYGENLWKVIVPKQLPIFHIIPTETSNWINECYKAKSPALYLVDYATKGTSKYMDWLFNTNYYNNLMLLKSSHNLDNLQYYTNNIKCNLDDDQMVKNAKAQVLTKHSIFLYIKSFLDNSKQKPLCRALLYNTYSEDNHDNKSFKNNTTLMLYNEYNLKDYSKILDQISISNIANSFITYKNNSFFEFMKEEYFPFCISELESNNLTSEPKTVQIDLNKSYNHLVNYFKNLQIDYEQLFTIIKRENAIISGSFVLSAVLDNKFKSNDIDIYIQGKYDKEHPILQFFTNLGPKISNKYRYIKIKGKYNVRIESISSHTPYSTNPVNKIVNLTITYNDFDNNCCGCIKLQLIFIEEDPYHFINNNFDFDFCKVSFDGDTFKSEHFDKITNLTGSICDKYLDSCWNLETKTSRYRIAKTIERIDKYMKRGFTIDNKYQLLDIAIKNLEYNGPDLN